MHNAEEKKYGIWSCVTIMETNIGCMATLFIYSRTAEWKLWNHHNIVKPALDNCELFGINFYITMGESE